MRPLGIKGNESLVLHRVDTNLRANTKPQSLDQDLHFAVAGAMRNVLESHKGGVVTLNLRPSTLHPKPKALNPKP